MPRRSSRTDEVVEDKGVKILIDPKAVLFLLGTEMDYKTDKLSAQFVFNNPNQTGACGCGESRAAHAGEGRGGVSSGHLLGDRRVAGGDFRIGLAHHPVAAMPLGGIEAGVGALDQGLRAVALCRVATPIEIVTRPRCSPVERFISSLVMTARRMWSATVIAERSTVLGRMTANSSPP